MRRLTRVLAAAISIAAGFPAASGGQISPDEQALRAIEDRLPQAWKIHDRAFIEGVLAPEWSVTQADGTMLSRDIVLGTFFDAVAFETNVVDEVTVKLFGTTAIVLGRTTATGTLKGQPFNARIRFTDVFIKRNGRWQVVASHASPSPAP